MLGTNTAPFPDKVRRVRAFAGALGVQPASTVLPSSPCGADASCFRQIQPRCLLQGKMGFGRLAGLITIGPISFWEAASARLQMTERQEMALISELWVCYKGLVQQTASDWDVGHSFELDNEG